MLDHHPRRPASNPSDQQGGLLHACWMLVTGGMVMLIANACFTNLSSLQNEIQLSNQGLLTTGVLTGRRQQSTGEDVDNYISYRFSLSEPIANREYRKEVSIRSHVYQVLERVRYVDVRYLPRDPRVSRLELAGSSALKYAVAALISLLVGSFFLLVLICMATGAALPSSRRTLR